MRAYLILACALPIFAGHTGEQGAIRSHASPIQNPSNTCLPQRPKPLAIEPIVKTQEVPQPLVHAIAKPSPAPKVTPLLEPYKTAVPTEPSTADFTCDFDSGFRVEYRKATDSNPASVRVIREGSSIAEYHCQEEKDCSAQLSQYWQSLTKHLLDFALNSKGKVSGKTECTGELPNLF